MNWLDFICLWVGYAVCVFALVSAVIDGAFAAYRSYRRMVRWMTRKVAPMTSEAVRAQGMIICANGTGDYVKKSDADAVRMALAEAIRNLELCHPNWRANQSRTDLREFCADARKHLR